MKTDNMMGFSEVSKSTTVSVMESVVSLLSYVFSILLEGFYVVFTLFTFLFVMCGFFSAYFTTDRNDVPYYLCCSIGLALVYLSFYVFMFKERR